MGTAPIFAATIRNAQAKIVNTDGTAAKTLMTAGASGSVVRAIWMSSNNDAAIYGTLLLYDGVQDYLIDSIQIPAATTHTPIQKINFLDPDRLTKLHPAQPTWYLASGHSFKVRVETAVSAGDFEVNALAEYGDV